MGALLYEHKGKNCEIKDLDGMLIAFGRLGNIIEDESTSVEIVPLDEKNELPLMEFNKNVKVSVRTDEDILILYGQVFISDRRYLKLANVRTFDSFERREFFRVKTEGKGFIEAENENGEQCLVSIQLKDVSLSGLKFTTELRIDVGYVLSLTTVKVYELEGSFNFTCKIIERIQTEKDEADGIYEYRCSIMEISDKELDRLCSAIFKIQRDEVKKIKEKVMYN